MDVIENEARQGSTKDAGEGQASQEERDGLSLFALAKPVGEVEDDSGEVASFGESEEKAKDIELGNVLDEAGESGEDSPGHDDACEPNASAEFVQQQVAGNFEQKVANEKDSGEQAELLGADAEVTVHGECGEADVDAVQEGDDIQNKDEGKDAKLNLTDGGGFECRGSICGCLCWSHADLAVGTTGSKRLLGRQTGDGVRDVQETVGEEAPSVKLLDIKGL